MVEETSYNQELPFLAAINTSILCIVFGANAVAIKISLFGLGTLQLRDSGSVSPHLRFFSGPKSPADPFRLKRDKSVSYWLSQEFLQFNYPCFISA